MRREWSAKNNPTADTHPPPGAAGLRGSKPYTYYLSWSWRGLACHAAWRGTQVARDCSWSVGGADPRQPPAFLSPDFSSPPCGRLFLNSAAGRARPGGESLLSGDWRGLGSWVNCARRKDEGQGQVLTCPPPGCDSGQDKSAYCLGTEGVRPQSGERVLLVSPGDSCGFLHKGAVH